ncbi:MAG: adenylate/guanylate cyclase domain-containing protein [Deltaproteobacteria bacterium]|nr:adenylate/guanylate cyclase domain-containing protein [Deltaproteobacteria bacterium]
MTNDATRERLEQLEARLAMIEEADATLEEAQVARLPLSVTLERMLPVLLSRLPAEGALVRTYGEDLSMREFVSGVAMESSGEALLAALDGERRAVFEAQGVTRVVLALDVAGESFGVIAARLPEGVLEEQAAHALSLLECFAEVLDNYLAAISDARKKEVITRAIGTALREPILDDGIEKALEALRREVPYDDLLLVFRHEDSDGGENLHYRIVQEGVVTHDSDVGGAMEVDDFIREHASAMIRGESRALLEHFGFDRFREEVLIDGVKDERVLGRLIITSRAGELNTFDRDLLDRFADLLRQRIVDWSREFRHLSLCFSEAHTNRLLRAADYRANYLEPRLEDVAILFSDISGFTRVSEQVLKDPALIGQLINTWGAQVVKIIWEEGGVFDKMVGDCVIGLFGPPFYELDAQARCGAAARAAQRIRDYTRTLGAAEGLPQLENLEPPIGVATGLNHCPLFVGLFGPNEDFTGFSSGMNNTARLQGVAERDEILCMESFVDTLDRSEAFAEARQAKVKNVAEPLRFRGLRCGSEV